MNETNNDTEHYTPPTYLKTNVPGLYEALYAVFYPGYHKMFTLKHKVAFWKQTTPVDRPVTSAANGAAIIFKNEYDAQLCLNMYGTNAINAEVIERSKIVIETDTIDNIMQKYEVTKLATMEIHEVPADTTEEIEEDYNVEEEETDNEDTGEDYTELGEG